MGKFAEGGVTTDYTKEYNKICACCDQPFIAHHNRALYCSNKCQWRGRYQLAKVKKSLGLLHDIGDTLLNKKLDFIIQVLSVVVGFTIPHELIGKENKVNLEDLGQFGKIIGKRQKENEKALKIPKRKIAEKKAPIKIYKKNISIQLEEKQKEEQKVSVIDYPKLETDVKSLIIKTIQKNTGKFPILPPQSKGKIYKIVDKVVSKMEGNLNNQMVLDYIEEKITDIKTMIDESYF